MSRDDSFVAQARRQVEGAIARWHEIRWQNRSSELHRLDHWPEIAEMFEKLVAAQTLLLRAVEEVEARPWWKPRRFNPYAR